MSADILSMLDGLRDNRNGKYMARCPAHDDRSPSLSVKLCDDGKVLLHCYAGCDVEAVCGAIGLTLADLMPERPIDHRVRPMRRTMPAREGLQSLDYESLVVQVIATDVHDHQTIDTPTWDRLAQSVARIGKVRDACMPARYRK
jgi:hypothetical protein